jgi:hypothetical protein
VLSPHSPPAELRADLCTDAVTNAIPSYRKNLSDGASAGTALRFARPLPLPSPNNSREYFTYSAIVWLAVTANVQAAIDSIERTIARRCSASTLASSRHQLTTLRLSRRAAGRPRVRLRHALLAASTTALRETQQLFSSRR